MGREHLKLMEGHALLVFVVGMGGGDVRDILVQVPTQSSTQGGQSFLSDQTVHLSFVTQQRRNRNLREGVISREFNN